MTTPNPDIAAWARGQLSDDARAVWFADPLLDDEPLRYEDMTGMTLADIEAWAAAQIEEGGE